jgi:hypothetical protein
MLRYAALIATAVLLACSASALAAPPPNDSFAAATALSPTQTTGAVATQQTLDGATVEPGELSPAPGTQTVWYRFVPTYTGTLNIDACDANFRIRILALTGASPDALSIVGPGGISTCAGYDGDSGTMQVTAGQEIRIRISSWQADVSGTHFTLRLNAPHNDDLLAADPMDREYGSFARLMGATKQLDEANHAGHTGGHSVWFTWKSGAAGPAKFSTCWFLTGFDTLLAVYQGSAFPLAAVASNDDDTSCANNTRASTLTFNAAANSTYRIALDGYNTVPPELLAAGAYIKLPPKNDQLADAFKITGSIGSGAWGEMATKEPGEPAHAGLAGGASTWWSWTATADGPTTFDTCWQYDDAPDTLLAVYKGDAYPLTSVASNDDTTRCGKGRSSLVTFDAVAGQTYKVAVDVKDGHGDVVPLNAGVPDNDFFASPAALNGSGTVDADLSVASAEIGEPQHAGSDAAVSRWWTYTAPADGTVHVDTCDTPYLDTVLEVYTGDALGSLTSVASSDDAAACSQHASSVDFAATAGTAYRIAIDGRYGFGGPVTLRYGGPDAPPPPAQPLPPAGTQQTDGPLLGAVHLGRARLSRLAAGRFAITAACLRACDISATLRSHGHRVAAGGAGASGAKSVKLRLRVPVRKRAGLRRMYRLRTRLVLTAIDPKSHVAAKLVRTVRFRR